MKVGVIMGGISSEREVSLKSGEEVIRNINSSKYEAVPIIIDKKQDIFDKVKGIDFAFIALHGKFGEDGTVQAVLQTLNIPYSGCGPLTSGICMDKDMTKKVLKSQGILTGKWINLKSAEEIDYSRIEELVYPVVVKPNNGGSSVATSIIKKKEDVEAAVIEALKYDNEVMIEEYIKGDEITCCIFNGEMYPILAIKPKTEFFDYTAKYADGGSDEIIVEFEEKLQSRIRDMALKCWDSLKCSVYARVDMIVREGIPYVLELNTLPGMTKNSLFPKSAGSKGISFSELLNMIIEQSLKENR